MNESNSDGCIAFSLIAVCVAGVLAMFATAFVVARYPIPGEDATHLALLGFFFVVFLDAFLIYRLIGPEFRKGQRLEAAKWVAALSGLGLCVGAIVGSLLWLTRWIPEGPWMTWVPWAFLALSLIPDLVRVWKRWRSRKTAS